MEGWGAMEMTRDLNGLHDLGCGLRRVGLRVRV